MQNKEFRPQGPFKSFSQISTKINNDIRKNEEETNKAYLFLLLSTIATVLAGIVITKS